MSRIDELVERLCPDGVAYRPLGEVATLVRGNGMPKKMLTDSGVGAIHYGQIYTHYGAWTDATRSFVSPQDAMKLARVDPGNVVVTNTSENLEDVGKAVAWMGDDQIVTGGHATVVKHSMNPKFLSYWFQTPSFAKQKRVLATGTKVIDVSARSLSTVVVPVPPLEVQSEVVRVLDCFTSLETELEAELEARRRQFDHYRQLLIQRLNAAHESLGSLGTWIGGMTPSKSNRAFWESGSIPWLASMDVAEGGVSKIRGRITELAMKENPLKIVSAPAIVVVMRSNILRRRLPIGLVDVDTTVNQDVKALIPRDGLDVEYISQVLISMSEDIRSRSVRTDGSMAALDSRSFYSCSIPVPSLREQEAVSARLRSFGEITSDLSAGLPAEIAARRQQYEYYRDRLLTFKEKAS